MVLERVRREISVPVCVYSVMNMVEKFRMILINLLKLPGVGRKSANLIMGDVFGKPAIVTDTHCIRLTNRIGLVDGIKEPKKVEMALWKIIPPQEGSDFCHRLVFHGRDVYGKDKAVLREVLSGGYLQEKRSFIKKKKEEAENEKFENKEMIFLLDRYY